MPVEQRRSQERRERILEAALGVFVQRGYYQASVDDIALASQTSKGGCYFHFPNKQSIFLALLDRMAALLHDRAEAAIAVENDAIGKIDAALTVIFQTFASHRRLSRLFLVEAIGAGPEFHTRMAAMRASFADLIRRHLDEAVRQGAIPPLDTAVTGRVWFGALNEVITQWVLTEPPTPLEEVYPTVRALLLRGIGVPASLPSRTDTNDSA